jgi:hypothetical protein
MTQGRAPSVDIRLATPDDAGAIERFYTANEHAFVAFRPERLVSLLAGRALVVAEKGGLIVGASGILHHGTVAGRQCVELVQGRVILEGRGLYRLLIACRLLLIEFRYPRSALVFCEVDEVNVRVRSIYSSLGFVHFAPNAELERLSIETLPMGRRPEALGYGFVWYEAGFVMRANIVERFCDSVVSRNIQPFDETRIQAQYCDQIRAIVARRACAGEAGSCRD